jgi:hypothetical protein
MLGLREAKGALMQRAAFPGTLQIVAQIPSPSTTNASSANPTRSCTNPTQPNLLHPRAQYPSTNYPNTNMPANGEHVQQQQQQRAPRFFRRAYATAAPEVPAPPSGTGVAATTASTVTHPHAHQPHAQATPHIGEPYRFRHNMCRMFVCNKPRAISAAKPANSLTDMLMLQQVLDDSFHECCSGCWRLEACATPSSTRALRVNDDTRKCSLCFPANCETNRQLRNACAVPSMPPPLNSHKLFGQ